VQFSEVNPWSETSIEIVFDAFRGYWLPDFFRMVIEGPPRKRGSMQCFLELMEELGVECLVGHPAKAEMYLRRLPHEGVLCLWRSELQIQRFEGSLPRVATDAMGFQSTLVWKLVERWVLVRRWLNRNSFAEKLFCQVRTGCTATIGATSM